MPGLSSGMVMSCWRVRKANEAISHSSAASIRWNRSRAVRGIGPSLLWPQRTKQAARPTIGGVTISPENQLAVLTAQPPYWTARAMQEQGSRFFQHLGAALAAADLANRRLIFQTWPGECWDFYQRGLALQHHAEDA